MNKDYSYSWELICISCFGKVFLIRGNGRHYIAKCGSCGRIHELTKK